MDREEFLKELEKFEGEKVILVETNEGLKKEIIIELLQEDNKSFYVSDISEDVEFDDLKAIGEMIYDFIEDEEERLIIIKVKAYED